MGSHGVKIPQAHGGQGRIGLGRIPQDLLDHQLGPGIGIGAAAGGHILPAGSRGVAVHRGRRAEDQPVYPVVRHHVQQGQGGVQVVPVIGQGLLHRLAHGLVSRQMDGGGNGMLPEHPVQSRTVRRVHVIERRGPARDLPDALRHVRAGIGQVVGNDHVIVPLQKLHGNVRADEPGSAGKQNSLFHGASSRIL